MTKRKSVKMALLASLLAIFLTGFCIRVIYPYQNAVYNRPVGNKVIAITFDDGPMPVYTDEILDILDEYHAKATFFMIGNRMKKYPDIVKEVARRGNVIGNHTFTHPKNLIALDDGQVLKEINDCADISERLTGQRNHIFRPPRGIMNERLSRIIRRQGYDIVFWSICADNRQAPTPELMARRVVDKIKPGEIILIHDGRVPGRLKDVEATRLIMADLSEKGYRFITVPELLQMQATNQRKSACRQQAKNI